VGEATSADGTWKIVVEGFSTQLLVYSAVGVKASVFGRQAPNWWERLWRIPAGWTPLTAETISAAGIAGSTEFGGVRVNIPDSGRLQLNAQSAECRAWAVGTAIKMNTGGNVVGGSGASGLTIIDLVVSGSGSAKLRGEILSARI
jgi:hypothetical protein